MTKQRSFFNEGSQPYQYPSTTLLSATPPKQDINISEQHKASAAQMLEVLKNYRIKASHANMVCGPSVTRYEVELAAGVRLSSLTRLADDIAMAFGTNGVTIAPVIGKPGIVGIDIPNKSESTVYIRELLDSSEYGIIERPTTFVLGRDIYGNSIFADIENLRHLFIAGKIGSGKSVLVNSIITSLLYKASPDQLLFIMADPDLAGLSVYNGIPHLILPVITDPTLVVGMLEYVLVKIDQRNRQFKTRNKLSISDYNEEILRENSGMPMPRILIILEEIADLLQTVYKDVEPKLSLIAQKAHIFGIHLILSTKKPEAKIITPNIKANIPSRIAFAVNSSLDSQNIIEKSGAESLSGRGDMLFLPMGALSPLRVKGCYISLEDVQRVVENIRVPEIPREKAPPIKNEVHDDNDPLLHTAVEVIFQTGQASVSMLQRRLKLGYARAARLMDQMESMGIVGEFEGSAPRRILVSPEEWARRREQ